MRIVPPQKTLSQHYVRQIHLDKLYELARTSGVSIPMGGAGGPFKESLYNLLCFARGRVQVGESWHEGHALLADVILAIQPQSLRKRLCVSLMLYGAGAITLSKNGDEAFWESVIATLEEMYISHVSESGNHDSDSGAVREFLARADSVVLTYDPEIANQLPYRTLWKSFGYVFRIMLAHDRLPPTPTRDFLFHAPPHSHAAHFNALPRAERFDWYIGTSLAFGDSHYITALNVAWDAGELTFASLGVSLADEIRSPFVAAITAPVEAVRDDGEDESSD